MIPTLPTVRAHAPGVYVGGFGVECAVIEALTKQPAAELGPSGVRVNRLRSEGSPESWEGVPTEDWSGSTSEIEARTRVPSVLGRATTQADVGSAAAFLASGLAAATTDPVLGR